MQSYCKYNNVQKFFSFFVYYRRVWHPAIPTQPPTTEIEKQEGVRIAESGVGIAGCHTLLNKKRQNSNKFWRLTVCRKRA